MNLFSLDITILLGVVLASILQSIFGVGVLLFGTPILLICGYSFPDILSTLLPISIGISLSQIIKDHRLVDLSFIRGIFIYTPPFIVLFLFIALSSGKNLGLFIALLLCLFAVKNFYTPLNKAINAITRFEKTWLILTGVYSRLNQPGRLPAHHTRSAKKLPQRYGARDHSSRLYFIRPVSINDTDRHD